MTKQEKIEQLQDWVSKNHIHDLDSLNLEISCAEYDGDDVIDAYDDILSPLELNTCDRCGDIWESERLFWECGDWDQDNEDLIKGIDIEGKDYTALCGKCVKELIEKGAK